MPVYQYEGLHYDLPDGMSDEQAINKIKTHLGQTAGGTEREKLAVDNVQQFYGDVVDNLTGVGQAAASLASSAVAMPAGFLAGALQKANDPSGVDFEKQVASNMDRLTYHPSRDVGNDYLEPVGKFFNDVGIPALAHMGGTQLPGLKDIQLQRAANKKAAPFPKDTRGLPTLEERMTAAKAPPVEPQPGVGAFDNIQAQLGFKEGEASPLRTPTDPMAQVADTLTKVGEDQRVRSAQEVLDVRQRELEQGVKTQTTLGMNAAERARQEAAPTISEAHRAVIEEQNRQRVQVEEAQRQLEEASKLADITEQQQRAMAEQQARIKAAQEALEKRQVQIDYETTRQYNLDFNAAERARQEGAGVPEGVGPRPEPPAPRIPSPHSTEVLRNLQESEMWSNRPNTPERMTLRRRQEEARTQRQAELEAQQERLRNHFRPNNSRAQQGPKTRAAKAIGQRGFANSQTGAISFGARDNIKKNNSDIFKAQKELETLSKAFWHDRSISSEEFRPKQQELQAKIVELERLNKKWQQTLPPGREAEIHPGFTKIPLGTEVMTTRRGELERATVRENRQVQYGDETTWYPRVEFSDGEMKRLTPNDIRKVLRNPFKGPGKNQAGAVHLPFGRKDAAEQIKKIGAFKKGAFFAEERGVPQLIEDLKTTPVKDIDQNVAQRISNSLTKGSIYMTDRTQNPVLKVVGDKIRQATNTALSVTREQVHDKLAPAWRDLSREEYTEAGAMMIAAEKTKFDLTPEWLAKEGMNDKQINAIMAQKEVMADMLKRTNDGLRALGKKEISGNVSNLASRANGDFRRVITNADKQVVGVVGARTRFGLNSQIKKLIAEHPEYKVGNEMYFGGRGKRAMDEGFAQLMDFLNQNDPNVTKFVEDLSGVISKDAFDYMNAKTHTMQKKGVFGMTGRKHGADMHQNVRDMVDAQIQHAETITKWSEISKAVGELKPLLEPKNGIEMPLAKQLARDYIEGALGNGPGAVGRALDDVFSGIGKTTGIGTSIPSHILSTNKKVVNGLLIGFGKLPFIAANMIQPVKNMIGQAAYLRSNGFETGFTMGMGKAMDTILREQFGKELSALDKNAIQYAKDNHVYSSSLFEAGNYSRKGPGFWWDHASQVGANKVEMLTRKMTFLSYVNMLHENGIKVNDGLYKAAQNLTDVHMNNYSNAEAPRVFQTLGGVGKSAYNLLSFKHNELSRIAMLAREIGKNGDARPLLWEMASQIAFGGIMGTILYQEANWAVEQITKAMGEPTSLTKILLENSDKLSTVFSRGAPTLAGIDMSTSLGMTVTPEPGLDMLHPGLGKTVDIAKAGYDAVTKPSAYNTAAAARQALPLSVVGLADTAAPFAKKQDNGNTMLRNPSTGEGTVTLTPAETFIKRLGFKSVGESTEKGLLFANDKISKVYAEKRGKVIDAALKNYNVYGKLPEGWAQDYVKNQGDPNTAVSEITNKLIAANVDRPTRELLINSMSNSVTSTHKLLRALKKE